MYAILFDLDINGLNENDEGNIYKLIKDFMLENGFTWKQDGVYFGSPNIDAVTCVLIVQKLAKKHPWFSTCIKDIRMLRIEENNDLLPAILI